MGYIFVLCRDVAIFYVLIYENTHVIKRERKIKLMTQNLIDTVLHTSFIYSA